MDLLTLRKIIPDTTRHYICENGHTNDVFFKLLASNESKSENYGKDVVLPAASLTPKERTMAGKHFLSVSMFSKKQLNEIFNVAQTMRARQHADQLQGRGGDAMSRRSRNLHGRNELLGQESEILEDSILVMAGYSDVVVLRHPEPGAVSKVAHHCRKPLINPGVGIVEHPTQALLEIFTIREEIGTVIGLTINIVRDWKHGRTMHS
ncbi:aspartate carbamoyltransferase [Culex quinquefasciatus]|uniref:Aspartate carbamoyltransferase n=1 Tax=Culex quinquefasciatus TaxID=7176 RepID=B0VZ98_CULQU|nr:aspartate carbamoyltransferase [Culex quinquefasciatus]|eukprot:XP_001841705.1 aspartate carbamoyltransferase [Culex quinquefasciatus]